jgi:hypothetical protein
MDLEQINRIEGEAAAEETQQQQAESQPVTDDQNLVNQNTAQQFAEFLDMAAKVAGHGLNVPTIPQRFNPQANLDIATAAVKLCDKYGIDAHSVLIGENSTIGAWLGLVVALGMPGYMVYQDIKLIKAKEAQEVKAANDDEFKQQSSK